MRRLTRAERLRLQGLTPHTRAHATVLLEWYPNLTISSGRRTHLQNRRAGGVPTSFHLRGRAVDFTGPLYDLQKAAELSWRYRVNRHCTGPEEVILEFSGTPRQHLHVAW